MRSRSVPILVAAMLAGAGGVRAQEPHPIVVESPRMQTGQPMPRDYTPDGRNVSPPLEWRNLPEGTRQIAIVCEDHGAGNPPPWVHWVVYNIPATASGLPEALPIYADAPMPTEVAGAVQGKNGWGRSIYRGPAPPLGELHNYNFFVYALDAELDLPAGLTRQELMEHIEGHVIGRGAIVPFYQRKPIYTTSAP